MNPPTLSITELTHVAQEMAQAMVTVAEQVALLGVEGNADEQMATIKRENDKVLDRIRQIHRLPPYNLQPTPGQ